MNLASTVRSLEKLCESYRSDLVNAAHLYYTNAWWPFFEKKDFLKRSVCGVVSSLLGYWLSAEGYDASEATSFLSWQYYTPSHTFLLINHGEIIVDASYYQFITHLCSERDAHPSFFLITPFNDLKGKIDEFVGLRNRNLKSRRNAKLMGERYHFFGMSNEDLFDYYFRIWDFKSQDCDIRKCRVIADVVELYRTNLSVLNEPSRNLMEHLESEGLLF